MEDAAKRRRSAWIWAACVALAAVTLALNGVTAWSAWTARSEVPWRDQWTYLEDARAILGGDWGRLWYSYWGNRLVVTRLLTMLDVRFFHGLNTPMVALSLVTQTLHAGLLAFVAWKLFARVSKALFVLVAAAIFHLCLSSLQLENLIWAGQVGFVVVSASATAAFVLLAMSAGRSGVKHAVFVGGAMAAAVVSTLASANGALVWPLFVAQACVLRARRRACAVLAVLGALVMVLYFWGYQAGPAQGMGVERALTHPWQSVPLLGALVVGPLTVVTPSWGMALGCAVLVIVVYLLATVFRRKSAPTPMLTAYGAVAVFSLVTMAALVVNRVTPEFFASRVQAGLLVLPSRYYSTAFFLWSSVLGIAVWNWRRRWPVAACGTVVLLLTLGTAWWQVGEAANWRWFFRELDVAATALIMDVRDPGNAALAQIHPEVNQRTRVAGWLRRERLSIFAERRGGLFGKTVTSAATPCGGATEVLARVGDGVYRVTGWVEDGGPRDLVLVNSDGLIVGLARSGLRRPDLPGKIGWQGYARVESDGLAQVTCRVDN